MPNTTHRGVAENTGELWLLAASPSLWAAHFMACYITGAIRCAKAAPSDASLETVRAAIGWYTLVALVAIAVVGWIGWRRHRLGRAELPHDADTPEDRHRFLGFAALLLSALSGVAVIYSALAAVFIRSCT